MSLKLLFDVIFCQNLRFSDRLHVCSYAPYKHILVSFQYLNSFFSLSLLTCVVITDADKPKSNATTPPKISPVTFYGYVYYWIEVAPCISVISSHLTFSPPSGTISTGVHKPPIIQPAKHMRQQLAFEVIKGDLTSEDVDTRTQKPRPAPASAAAAAPPAARGRKLNVVSDGEVILSLYISIVSFQVIYSYEYTAIYNYWPPLSHFKTAVKFNFSLLTPFSLHSYHVSFLFFRHPEDLFSSSSS